MKSGNHGFIDSNVDDKINLDLGLTSVSPNTASVSGGTVITFSGTRFCQNNIDLKIDGQSVVDFKFNLTSSTKIEAMVPVGPLVTTSVKAFSFGVMEVDFTYTDSGDLPEVTSLSGADSLSVNGGILTISGVNFEIDSDVKVQLGKLVGSVGLSSETEIIVFFDKLDIGEHLLSVDFDGKTAKGNFQINIALAVFKTFPSSSSIYGGENIEIHGTGFGQKTEDLEILLKNDMSSTVCEIISVSNSLILCNAPTSDYSVSIYPDSEQTDDFGDSQPNYFDQTVFLGQTVNWCWNTGSSLNFEIYEIGGSWRSESLEGVSGCVSRTFTEAGEFNFETEFLDDSFSLKFSNKITVSSESDVDQFDIVVQLNGAEVDLNFNDSISSFNNCQSSGNDGKLNRSFQNSPEVTSFSVSSDNFDASDITLNLAITDASLYTSQCIKVEVAGVSCENLSLDSDQASCSISSTNASDLKVFTDYQIETRVVGFGAAGNKYTFKLVPGSSILSDSSGSENGGHEILIQGNGVGAFEGASLSVNSSGEISSVETVFQSYNEVKFLTPPGSGNVVFTLSYDSENTLNFSYSYDAAKTPVISVSNIYSTSESITFAVSNIDENVSIQNSNIKLTRKMQINNAQKLLDSGFVLKPDAGGYYGKNERSWTYAETFDNRVCEEFHISSKVAEPKTAAEWLAVAQTAHHNGYNDVIVGITRETGRHRYSSTSEVADLENWNGVGPEGLWCDRHQPSHSFQEKPHVFVTNRWWDEKALTCLKSATDYHGYRAVCVVELEPETEIDCFVTQVNKNSITCQLPTNTNLLIGEYQVTANFAGFGSSQQLEVQVVENSLAYQVNSEVSEHGNAVITFTMHGSCENCDTTVKFVENGNPENIEFSDAKYLGNDQYSAVFPALFQGGWNLTIENKYAALPDRIHVQVVPSFSLNSITVSDMNSLKGGETATLTGDFENCEDLGLKLELFNENHSGSSQIDCDSKTAILTSMPAGVYNTKIVSSVFGDSNVLSTNLTFNLIVDSARIQGDSGSLGGGQILQVSGEGFSFSETKISFCGIQCNIIENSITGSSPENLSCITGKFSSQDSVSCSLSVTTTAETTVSRQKRSNSNFNELIFHETWENFDNWQHDVTFNVQNNEFQYYRNDPKNIHLDEGKLVIKPTLTADEYDAWFLHSGTIDLGPDCTDSSCSRTGYYDYIIPPVQSAKITSKNKFSFKYGRVEFEAKLPKGDWLWPAFWMMPENSVYGEWPKSGEIDILEYRGNAGLNCDGNEIGANCLDSTLHFGKTWTDKSYDHAHSCLDENLGDDFHMYVLEWDETGFKTFIDGVQVMDKSAPENGFCNEPGSWWCDAETENLWSASNMAPFDQDFYLIINLAVGGDYFPDNCVNRDGIQKPWSYSEGGTQSRTFWWGGDTYSDSKASFTTWENPVMEIKEIKIFGEAAATTTTTTAQETSTVTTTEFTATGIPENFDFSNEGTPKFTGISKTRGGSAGGSTLVLTGSGFVNQPTVSIDGSNCEVISFTETEITCVTSPASYLGSKAVPKIEIENKGSAWFAEDNENLVFSYVDLWSSTYTWGCTDGSCFPKTGEIIVVQEGQHLVLDIDTPLLKALVVMGGTFEIDREIVSDTVTLSSEYIIVLQNGHFMVGTEDNPFPCDKSAEIVLFGHQRSIKLPIYGAKVLAVRSGKLDLHGCKKEVTWTVLNDTVEAGASEIKLKNSVDWSVGDQIVIATTGGHRSQKESETADIIAISEDSKTLTLKESLEYQHLGRDFEFPNYAGEIRVLSQRAEIGLLTRNVRVRGNVNEEWLHHIPACVDENGVELAPQVGLRETQTCFQGQYGDEVGSDQFGSQVMLHEDIEYGKIEYVEVTHAGQAFGLGRYPLHFHLSRDQPNSYIRGCGIHHTFNRAITLHAVNYLTVENNVAFNIMGLSIFIEDANEEHNVIQNNLVVFTRPSSSLLNVDQTPAAFWITNPNNIIRNNHAAGYSHIGFWINPPGNPTGPSFTPDYCPRNQVIGEFFNNTAHSGGVFGLWIFESYFATKTGECAGSLPGGLSNPDNIGSFTLDDFYTWGNKRGAETTLGAGHSFKRFLGAANWLSQIAIMENEGILGEIEISTNIYDSIAVGYLSDDITDEVWGREGSQAGLIGIETPWKLTTFYVDGLAIHKMGSKGFGVDSCYNSYAFDCVLVQWYKNVLWGEDVPVKSQFDWEHEVSIIDLDGSYSETGRPSVILPKTDLVPPGKCVDSVAHSGYPGSHPGIICEYPDVYMLRTCFNRPDNDMLLNFPAVFENFYGRSVVPFRHQRVTAPEGWCGQMLANTTNKVSWDAFSPNHTFHGEIRYLTDNVFVRVQADFSSDLQIDRMEWGEDVDLATGVNRQVDHIPTIEDESLSYNLESRTGIFHKFGQSGLQLDQYRLPFKYKAYQPGTPDEGPVTEAPLDPNAQTECFWSDPNCWDWGVIPSVGDVATIKEGHTVIVDVELVEVEYVYVMGVLKFDNSMDHVFKTKGMQVKGNRGWSNRQKRETLVLEPLTNDQARYINSRSKRQTENDQLNGLVEIGTADSPWPCDKHFELVFTGDYTDTVQAHSGGIAIGAKTMAVYGGLKVYGCAVENSKGLLKTFSAAGTNSVELQSAPIGWKNGGKVAISSSTVNYAEHEYLTVKSIEGTVVTFEENLAHDKSGSDETRQTFANGVRLNKATEVIYLTRNVKFSAENQETDNMDSYGVGGRILVGARNAFSDETGGSKLFGFAQIDNVEFAGMGQYGYNSFRDPRSQIVFYKTAGKTGDIVRPVAENSFVQNCAFSYGYGVAISSYFTDNLVINKNVAYHSIDNGIRVFSSDNNRVTNNFVIMVKQRQVLMANLGLDLGNSNVDSLEHGAVGIKIEGTGSTEWFS